MISHLSASSRIVQARLHPWRSASLFNKIKIVAFIAVLLFVLVFSFSKLPPGTTNSFLVALGLRVDSSDDDELNDATSTELQDQTVEQAAPVTPSLTDSETVPSDASVPANDPIEYDATPPEDMYEESPLPENQRYIPVYAPEE